MTWTLFIIWDCKTGKIIKSYNFPPQIGAGIFDVSDHTLVFSTQPDDELSKSLTDKPVVRNLKSKSLTSNSPTLNFSFWDLDTLQKMGDITEKFTREVSYRISEGNFVSIDDSLTITSKKFEWLMD